MFLRWTLTVPSVRPIRPATSPLLSPFATSESTSVSRRHLDIYFDGHIAVMHDLGSTNGTTVNGSSVQTWQLADGDVIRLGHSSIIYNQHG